MINLRVSQLNVEVPVTFSVGDVLHTEAESTQRIHEKITTYSSVVVTCVNLEIPVGQVAPTPPPVVTPGDGDTAPAAAAFVGAPAIQREKFVSVATSAQELDESIIEMFVTSATSTQIIDTLVHQKIVESIPAIVGRVPEETIKFDTVRFSRESVTIDQPEVSKDKLRQKEEDELILLGVLG